MVDPKAWIIEKMRSKKKPPEKIHYPSAMEQLEKHGFKNAIKGDNLERRVTELRNTLAYATDVVYSPETSDEEKGMAVDLVYEMTTIVAIPYMRAMDNAGLEEREIAFIQNFREWRRMPSFFDHILETCSGIINKAFCNIDVEPRTPILIQTWQQQPSGVHTKTDSTGTRMMTTKLAEMDAELKRLKNGR